MLNPCFCKDTWWITIRMDSTSITVAQPALTSNMAKILLPVLAVHLDHENFASSSNDYVNMFHDMWGHLVTALEVMYELKYVTSLVLLLEGGGGAVAW